MQYFKGRREEIKVSKLQWQCIQSVLTRERESTDVRAFTATPVARCLSSSSSTSPSAHHSAQAFTLRLMNITSTSSTKSSLSKSHHNHPKMKSAHQTHTISHNFPEKMVEEVEQHWDCLVIGAGISGLDAAYHLKVFNMNKTRPSFERC